MVAEVNVKIVQVGPHRASVQHCKLVVHRAAAHSNTACARLVGPSAVAVCKARGERDAVGPCMLRVVGVGRRDSAQPEGHHVIAAQAEDPLVIVLRVVANGGPALVQGVRDHVPRTSHGARWGRLRRLRADDSQVDTAERSAQQAIGHVGPVDEDMRTKVQWNQQIDAHLLAYARPQKRSQLSADASSMAALHLQSWSSSNDTRSLRN